MSPRSPRRPGRPRPPGAEGISPERVAAYDVLRRVDGGAFADRAFAAVMRRGAVPRQARGAAMRLSYGTVQRRRTLDWLVDAHLDRPERVQPEVRDVLRLGAYELVFSDATPPSAAVDQAVRLARAVPGAPARASARAGLVNAVLRTLARDADQARERLAGDGLDPGIRFSFPDWMVEALERDLGAADARGLMEAANRPAESALRWNPLRGPKRTLTDALGVPWHGDPELPEAVVLDAPLGFEDTPAWRRGLAMPQSRASMLPARVLDPRARERVLDLCAAPGAKSTHLAALSANGADITCVELHDARADQLRVLGRRMGARLRVVAGDGVTTPLDGGFDAVLVDVPCTGLGVLSARPDARWRRRPELLGPLHQTQRALLARALDLVRPGGRVVYSTCTVLAAENDDVVRASGADVVDLSHRFPAYAHPRLPGALLSLPHIHGTDGFFVAELRPH